MLFRFVIADFLSNVTVAPLQIVASFKFNDSNDGPEDEADVANHSIDQSEDEDTTSYLKASVAIIFISRSIAAMELSPLYLQQKVTGCFIFIDLTLLSITTSSYS